MIAAMVTVCGMWGVSWFFGKSLTSGWGVLLPCGLLPFLALADLSLEQLRTLVVVAMLTTLVMLLHKTLRHYMLLPSFVAVAGGLAALWLNVNLL